MSRTPLIPKHGGFRNLKSFQLAQLVYDVTARFTVRYIDGFSRTRDQMVQAARSGVQNIAEGSEASATSKKMEITLTNVAQASLAELQLDYQDFLRQRGLREWDADEPLRQVLVARRCATADDVARWVVEVRTDYPRSAAVSTDLATQEIAANAALVLIGITRCLLKRQLATLAAAFEENGGFSERLYRVRSETRRQSYPLPTQPE